MLPYLTISKYTTSKKHKNCLRHLLRCLQKRKIWQTKHPFLKRARMIKLILQKNYMMFTVLYFPNKVKLKNFRLKAYFLAHEQHKIQTWCGNTFHNLLYRPPFYEHCLKKLSLLVVPAVMKWKSNSLFCEWTKVAMREIPSSWLSVKL